MRKQLNHNSSILSKILVTIFATTLTIMLCLKVVNVPTVLNVILVLIIPALLAVVVYITLVGEKVEFDEKHVHWKPLWSRHFLSIPLENIKSINQKPTFTHEGLTILNKCTLVFTVGQKIFKIKFTFRQDGKSFYLFNELMTKRSSSSL
jgi:hypothetical protein